LKTYYVGSPLQIRIVHHRAHLPSAFQIGLARALGTLRGMAWSPPTDVFMTDDGGLVRIEVAGMLTADLSVSLDHDVLIVTGERAERPVAVPAQCFQKEISAGRFRTQVAIPWPVDVDRAEAAYEDGFLTVHLPRRLDDR
jgi:HSP20 family protein